MWSIQEKIPSSIPVSSLSALFPWGQGMRGYSLQALGAGLGFIACRMGRIGVAGKVWALSSPGPGVLTDPTPGNGKANCRRA